jgi:hypothetical protein
MISVSTLQCTNLVSVDLRTVPLIPIKQCSFELANNPPPPVPLAFCSFPSDPPALSTPRPFFLVLTQTISSARLNPHLAKHSRPFSNPSSSPFPTQRNTKLGSAEIFLIGSSAVPSHVSRGRRRITSNLLGLIDDINVFAEVSARGRSNGGCAFWMTCSVLRSINLRSAGYLSSAKAGGGDSLFTYLSVGCS